MVMGKRQTVKLTRPILALIAATVFLIAAAVLVLASASDASTGNGTRPPGCLPYLPDKCPAEHILEPPVTTTTSTSTTTTIDLSFLNSTTTSVPKYRNTRPTPTTLPIVTPEALDSSKWDLLAECETGGDWSTNTGNGFGGGLQFAHGPGWSTWRAYGGEEFTAHPWEATREQQIVIAERVLAGSGWRAWPGCSRRLGLL